MDTEAGVFHVFGPAGLALVDRALDELDRLWERASDVPSQDRILFALALSEVTTNIAQHNDTADVVLSIDVRVTTDTLRACIRDTAPPAPVDWDAVSMPDEAAESGRGLALSQAALDEFTHTVGAHGNTWVLVRRVDGQRDTDG